MSINPFSGKLDPPDCDTHEGLLKRVKVLEQTVNAQTEVLRDASELIVDMVKVFGYLKNRT